MSADMELEFLRNNQPLPPTREASDAVLKQFDSARKLFSQELDHRSVPLLIGALGEGDGHGVYQMVEETLQHYPDEIVISALREGLKSQHPSVRYWSAQFAASYPMGGLLTELVNVFENGCIDEQIAALTAIELIGTIDSKAELSRMFSLDLKPPVREMLNEILGCDN